jgi:hypothetical protein
VIILNEGKGAFSDYPKYRQMMIDYVWLGKVPELTDEQKAQAAKESIGEPTPEDALAEAKRLREMMNARHQPPDD